MVQITSRRAVHLDKLHVLVVEDERPLLQELIALPWESWGARLCGAAANGAEAWDILQNHAIPDVIFTDITMPLQTGLELLDNVKSHYSFVQVVFLTCHNDFQFAQQAIQRGALDYILKMDLSPSRLSMILDRARENLQRELTLERLQWERDARRWHDFGVVSDRRRSYALPRELQRCLPCVPVFLVSQDLGVDQRCIADFLFREIQTERRILDAYEVAEREYIVFFKENRENIGYIVGSFVADLGITIGMGSAGTEYSSVPALMGEIVYSAEQFVQFLDQLSDWRTAIFYGGNDILKQQFVEPARQLIEEDYAHIKLLSRRQCLDAGQIAKFLTHEFKDWARRGRFDPEEVKRLLAQWISEWYDDLRLLDNPNDVITRVYSEKRFANLVCYLSNEITCVMNNRTYGRWEIRRAQSIIMEYLSTEISLEFVAEKVHLSSGYLSRLFKQETGQGFHEYVLHCRMKKARKLLRDSDLKVYQVAEEVGIPNYRYFCEVFKRMIGVTPTSFKKGQ